MIFMQISASLTKEINYYFKWEKAHKKDKVEKYYSDYYESITLMVKGSSKKIKITSVTNKANAFHLQTYTINKLKGLIGIHNPP